MKLLQPISIREMTLSNRMVLPPMGTDFAVAGSHRVTDRFIAYMVERAWGGAGLLINEYVAVLPGGLASPRQLGLWNDDFIPGFKDLVTAVHQAGAAIAVQLHHAGRETTAEVTGGMPVAASAVPSPRKGGAVRALEVSEIPALVDAFVQAALRSREAGFDAVELHGAHGYLVAGFMSPHGNRRSDCYGGDFQGYLRFPLEVIRAVRQAVGANYPIGFRISGDEFVSDGRTLSESVAMAPYLQEAGVDYLHVSAGTSASLHTIIAPMAYALGWNTAAAAAIKKAVSIPVMAVGRIHEPALAEEVIASGQADLVALGRALLADAQFPRRVMEGRSQSIRRCLGCLGGCMEEPVQCTQNPRLGQESGVASQTVSTPKHVLVVGGGVAGLEAACVAAERGHRVTLLEAQPVLGGQVNLAAQAPHKQRLLEAVNYRVHSLQRWGVTLERGVKATASSVLAHEPDVVIIATGAIATPEDLPKGWPAHQVTYAQVLSGEPVGERLMVMGGDMIGLETAEFLAAQGKCVTVVEQGDEIATDMPGSAAVLLCARLREAGVEVLTNARIIELTDCRVRVSRGEEQRDFAMDTVVMAARRQSVNQLAEQLRPSVPELYVIGDAVTPRRLQQAIREADAVAREI